MAKKIIWNTRARNDLVNIIQYLSSEWGDNVTRNFVIHLDNLIDLIAEYPELGKIEEKTNGQVRKIVITKHTTLFYRIEISRVVLLSIFGNRQHPNKKVLR